MPSVQVSYNQVIEGQVAVVTGASSGLGRAVAVALAHAGANVALLARSEEGLREVAGEVEAAGHKALPLPLDLADEDGLEKAIEQTVQAFGRIDLLVNAAGTDVPGPVTELTGSDWNYVLNVNLRAPFLLAKAVFPHMQTKGRGTIINVSSVAGKRGWANAAAYCASKFGLTGLTQSLAAEGKPYGIRVCAIYPGGLATNWGAWSDEERGERYSEDRKIPSPSKAMPPQEAASLIVWIAAAPPELVLNEVIITPIEEEGWP